MSRTVQLAASGSVVLGGTGAGTVQIGPSLPGVSWTPGLAAVIVAPVSLTVVSEFFLYGPGGVFLGGTYTGDNNSCGISGVTLFPGQVITGTWTGGNPGALATLTLTGTMDIPA